MYKIAQSIATAWILAAACLGSMTPADSGGNTGPAGTRDDGFGQCPAFTHKHPTIAEVNAANKSMGLPDFDPDDPSNKRYFTGGCFDDEDNPVNNFERRRLPKPAFHPDPELNWL